MPRATTPSVVAPAPDPLADLRAPDEAPGPPAGEPEPDPVQEVKDVAWHNRATDLYVVAWHGDTVGIGLLHGGGVCGCRHLAAVALQALYGPPVAGVEPEAEGDPEAPQ